MLMMLSYLQAMNGSISSVSICLAYVADKLPPGHRAACFGLILASFSMGILIGPPIGGLLPPIIASYTAISCVLGSLLYVVVVLEESLSERSRNEVSQRGTRLKPKRTWVQMSHMSSWFLLLCLSFALGLPFATSTRAKCMAHLHTRCQLLSMLALIW